MIGFAPLPYAPNVIGEPLDPLDGATSEVPYQISPRLNKIESPAENVDPFTFAIVCHGALAKSRYSSRSPQPPRSKSSPARGATAASKITTNKTMAMPPASVAQTPVVSTAEHQSAWWILATAEQQPSSTLDTPCRNPTG